MKYYVVIDEVELKNDLNSIEKLGNIAIMISDGNGSYVESSESEFPTMSTITIWMLWLLTDPILLQI